MVAAGARYAAERELFVAAELAAAASGSNKLVASFLPAPQGLDQPKVSFGAIVAGRWMSPFDNLIDLIVNMLKQVGTTA